MPAVPTVSAVSILPLFTEFEANSHNPRLNSINYNLSERSAFRWAVSAVFRLLAQRQNQPRQPCSVPDRVFLLRHDERRRGFLEESRHCSLEAFAFQPRLAANAPAWNRLAVPAERA